MTDGSVYGIIAGYTFRIAEVLVKYPNTNINSYLIWSKPLYVSPETDNYMKEDGLPLKDVKQLFPAHSCFESHQG